MATSSSVDNPSVRAMETTHSIHDSSIHYDHVSSAATTLHDAPTESHALAVADYDEKGVAEEDHDEDEVRDLGWHENIEEMPHPLVAGLTNEDLWMLIRRFNKVCRWKYNMTNEVLIIFVANVPCQGHYVRSTRWPGSQYCQGRGVLARQVTREHRAALYDGGTYQS